MTDRPSAESDRAGHERRRQEEISLTLRESEVLRRVQRGLENKTIAFELGMAEQTVKDHVSILLRKFGVTNRTALAEAASALQLTGERGLDPIWLPQLFRHAVPQICVLRGPDLRYEAVNDAFRQAVGDRAVIGRTMREAFPELAGQGIFELVERVYATGEPAIEHEAIRSWDRGTNGIERRLVDLILQPLRDEKGAVNGVVSFALDVTDVAGQRRRAELLREEFVGVLDLVPSGVMVFDDAGRIVTMNAAAQRIARSPIDPERPISIQSADVFEMRDRSGQRLAIVDTPVSRALRGETITDEVFVFPRGDPPEDVRVRLSSRPLRDGDGSDTGGAIRGAIAVFTKV